MPALARGQENQPSIVNWFLTVNGTLTDAHEIGFQIWNIVGGLPGTQVFPVAPGTWEEVTTGTGHFSPGSYYAYNNTAARGWTPDLGEPIGTHRIMWRWKISAGAPYQSGAEDFEVLVESSGGTVDTYIDVADVRAEGITIAMASDVKVLAYIETWQAFIERACRQWFNLKTKTLLVDGNDSDTLHFGVPIYAIDYLKLNGDTNSLDSGLYKIYSDRTFFVDRQNPCIKLVGPDSYRNIYTSPITVGKLKFRKGRQNQEIHGTFGYVEDDGSVPKLIKRALLKVVIEKLTDPIYKTAPPSVSVLSKITGETTDAHSIEYGEPGGASYKDRRVGLSGMTDDPEVLDIIKLYKAPIGVATPADWS